MYNKNYSVKLYTAAAPVWDDRDLCKPTADVCDVMSSAKYPFKDVYVSKDRMSMKVDVALAGFTRECIDVIEENGQLVIHARAVTATDPHSEWEPVSSVTNGISKRDALVKLDVFGKYRVNSAVFINGILTVILAKPEEMKPRTIKVL